VPSEAGGLVAVSLIGAVEHPAITSANAVSNVAMIPVRPRPGNLVSIIHHSIPPAL
jgi:hypothetical protein